jgi:hypothetical protein
MLNKATCVSFKKRVFTVFKQVLDQINVAAQTRVVKRCWVPAISYIQIDILFFDELSFFIVDEIILEIVIINPVTFFFNVF